jgi:two-component system, OmpR family, sensor kinase
MRWWPSLLRVRLTLWFTLVLGAPLIAFAVASYVIFERTLVSRTDQFMRDALTAFSRELVAERRLAPSTDRAVRTTLDEVRFRELQILILDDSARVLGVGASAEPLPTDRPSGPPIDVQLVANALRQHAATSVVALTLSDTLGGFRVRSRPFVLGGESIRLVGAYPLRDMHDILERILNAFLVVIPLILVSAAIGGYFLAKRSLSPVSAMGARAAEISATNLHERLPVASPGDELGGLATVINDLLDRLERAFAQQRRFMADASHELRTPTAILRSEADVTLSREHRSESEYRESVVVMQDAANRLTRIVDDLFLLARADAGHLVVRQDQLYLEEIVQGATRGVRHIADRRAVRVVLHPFIEAPLRGDADLLGRLVLNLLDNAIKHSPGGAAVEVELSRQGESYEISVVDSGPGIPPDVQERIFERFFRVDVARSRSETTETSGAGLGLAIARHIAEAHGGRLELRQSRPGHTEFRVTLPVNCNEPGVVTV